MKCDFCGQSLSLEEEVCSHCGQPNPHAQQHIRDMKRYKGEFENTRKGVYAVTGKYAEATVRVIVIAVLVVLITLVLYVYNNAYSLYCDYLRGDAIRNAKEYKEMMDRYIAEEDFRRLSLFCEEHAIGSYMEEYQMYAPVMRTVDYYVWFCDNVMEFVTLPVEEGETPDWDYVAYTLNEFYNAYDWSKYENDDDAGRPENVHALETMEKNMKLMLQTYLGFTKEETAGLRELSEAKRTVLFEEKFN